MGKESGEVAVIIIRTIVDKDIIMVMEDLVVLGAAVISDHMMVKLTCIVSTKVTKP